VWQLTTLLIDGAYIGQFYVLRLFESMMLVLLRSWDFLLGSWIPRFGVYNYISEKRREETKRRDRRALSGASAQYPSSTPTTLP
jgi:hypothetical protein